MKKKNRREVECAVTVVNDKRDGERLSLKYYVVVSYL